MFLQHPLCAEMFLVQVMVCTNFTCTELVHIWQGYLKALCQDIWRNCFLMSSKIQSIWVQEVWAHPILRQSAWEYVEMECMQCKDFVDDRVEKLTMFSYGQPKGKNTDKGYRAHMMIETSKCYIASAGRLECRSVNLLAVCHTQVSFSAWRHANS